MTTYVLFRPTPDEPFNFTATLDGSSYSMTVGWNVFGQRWYLTCTGTNGLLVFHMALIGSPDEFDINLLGGYFEASQMIYREYPRRFEITP
jgi:hypothetical protein